jgi:hypothetical protein
MPWSHRWWHSWRLVEVEAPYRFYECRYCPARSYAQTPGTISYAPPDPVWLRGGD